MSQFINLLSATVAIFVNLDEEIIFLSEKLNLLLTFLSSR